MCTHSKRGYLDRLKLIDCDNETDTWKCRDCDKIIERPCNFEDDYT